ncbi:DUF6933 domain-containing protein [Symmachiella dynata]|uniref:DUF6933 domain-containing protein n=1 Tax=Symmachiella dynata TaxID=2527995 RepID=UPI003B84B58B
MKAGPLDMVPLDDNPYAYWSAHLFTAERTQYIILSNTKSLCSCVIFGKGIPDRLSPKEPPFDSELAYRFECRTRAGWTLHLRCFSDHESAIEFC